MEPAPQSGRGQAQANVTNLEQDQSRLGEKNPASIRQSVVHGWLAALSRKIEPAETEMAAVKLD